MPAVASPASPQRQAASAGSTKKATEAGASGRRRRLPEPAVTQFEPPLLSSDACLLEPFGLEPGELIICGGGQLARVAGVAVAEASFDGSGEGDGGEDGGIGDGDGVNKPINRIRRKNELWVSMPLDSCRFSADGGDFGDVVGGGDDSDDGRCRSPLWPLRALFPTSLRPGDPVERAPEHMRIGLEAWESRREQREKKREEKRRAEAEAAEEQAQRKQQRGRRY